MSLTLDEVLALVAATPVPQIRAGDHEFRDIWIVEAERRLFCRQYSFAADSWRAAFLADPVGAIRCGDVEIPVRVVAPADLDAITPAVNQAYLDKHDVPGGDYREIAREMAEPKFAASTMEVVPQF